MDIQKEMGSADKNWLSKPEGKMGLIVGAGAIGAAGYGLYHILPFIISLLENTIYTAGLVGVLFVITAPVWNTNIRNLCKYMYKSVMRKLTGFFIELNPIGILKNYIDELKKSYSKMEAQIANLQGHIQRLRGIIAKNASKAEASMKIVAVAKGKEEQGAKEAFQLNARIAGRLEQSNETLQSMLSKMELLYKNLNKMSNFAQLTIKDMESEVEVKQQEREMILAAHGAFTSALKILRGEGTGKELHDQALDFLADDYSSRIGQIEHFMTNAEGFIASVDLDNMVFEKDALDKLDAMSNNTDSILSGGSPISSSLQHKEQEVSEVEALFSKHR